jgi:hypothetical protein
MKLDYYSVLQLLKCRLGGITSLRAPPTNVPQARPERGVWIQNRLDAFSWHLGSCNTTSESDEMHTISAAGINETDVP